MTGSGEREEGCAPQQILTELLEVASGRENPIPPWLLFDGKGHHSMEGAHGFLENTKMAPATLISGNLEDKVPSFPGDTRHGLG